MHLRTATLLLVFAMLPCGNSRSSLEPFVEEFVYTTLSFSPVSATAAGYHSHHGKDLDTLLDNFSPAEMDRRKQFYRGFRERMTKAIPVDHMEAEDRADYQIIGDQISLALHELDQIQSHVHNPTLYVETIGNALFSPKVLEYAPKPKRIEHIIARLELLPAFLDQAKKTLTDSPEIWTEVAAQENEGNIDLIDKQIRSEVPRGQRRAYDQAAVRALQALRDFQNYLRKDLSRHNQYDWRLGREKYGPKFRYVMETYLSPAQVLASAEGDLKRVRTRMLEIALPLHRRMYPDHAIPEQDTQVISEVLSRVSDRHATPDTYIAAARRDLDEARQFVRTRKLLPLPPRDNLEVIETPEFMRGIYAVGGFAEAPALEPKLGAFYLVTPIPKEWPGQRIQSKLREYNFYKLKLLTIHEAMPGHYVQMEYAHDIQPASRRILRSLFGNGPYVEGWAQYATQMMLDEGYLGNSPELRLTFLKEELRVLANAILDIRLHTEGMTDQQALDLMQVDTFQEKEEATGKLQRAKLSSCQLPVYLVGVMLIGISKAQAIVLLSSASGHCEKALFRCRYSGVC